MEQARAGRGGLSAAALKYIAIFAMVVDHAAILITPDYYSPLGALLHTIGRITGPVMFYFVAEGYHNTRNVNRYTLRMAVFALLSHLPFIYFYTGLPFGQFPPPVAAHFHTGVIYTLFLGLLALRARHEIKNTLLRWLCIVALLFLSQYGDWSYFAVLYILLFDALRGDFNRQALGYSALVLVQILPVLLQGANALLQGQPLAEHIPYLTVQLGMFLPIVLLKFYNGKKGRSPRWLFYVFYPAHLILLVLLRGFLTPG